MNGETPKPNKPSPSRSTLVLLGGLGLFLLGVFVGNGQLTGASVPQGVDPSPLWRLWNSIQRDFDGEADPRTQLYGAMDGLVESLGDPYSEFMTPSETKDFKSELAGQVEGIGAEVGIREERLVVIAPIEGSPADRAGLQAGDRILAVDGAPTDQMTLSEAVGKIRGPKGSTVRLTIGREDQTQEVTITRDLVQVESVRSRNEQGFAYIKVSRFSQDTDEAFQRHLKDRLGQNPRGVILDLRGNPGGYLDSGVEIASEFLPRDAVILREKARGRETKTIRSEAGGLLTQSRLPIVVLVDRGSASASEILAGALRDHNKATVVGEQTFGKGSVQDFKELPGGSSVRLTIAHWFTPDGHEIQGEGLRPDLESVDNPDTLQDEALERALQYLRENG